MPFCLSFLHFAASAQLVWRAFVAWLNIYDTKLIGIIVSLGDALVTIKRNRVRAYFDVRNRSISLSKESLSYRHILLLVDKKGGLCVTNKTECLLLGACWGN